MAPTDLDIGSWTKAHADLERLDRELLLAEVLKRSRTWIIAHPETVLNRTSLERLDALAARLRTQEPLAYLTGKREFWGLEFEVTQATLVPRPETELLVETALAKLASTTAAKKVLDLGTGSGCIAVALAVATRDTAIDIDIDACDQSAAALRVAIRNAANHSVAVEFFVSDWFEHTRGPYDLIVSNPPYVASEDPHLPALRHEPLPALVAGPDGLAAIRTIVGQSPDHLAAGGWLLVEHGYNQAPEVQALYEHHGFVEVGQLRDLGDQPRVTMGRLPG